MKLPTNTCFLIGGKKGEFDTLVVSNKPETKAAKVVANQLRKQGQRVAVKNVLRTVHD